jgi:hypothetical protein
MKNLVVMNKLLYVYLCVGMTMFSCDLERIEPNSGNATKFNTSVGGNGNDFPYDVLANADGSFIVAGRTQSFTADMNNQAYIVKVNSSGVLVDQNNFGFAGDDWAVSITPVSDGGYVFAGLTKDPVNFDFNLFLLKVNSSLDEVWRNTFGSSDSNEIAFGIIPTGTSDFMVGYTAQSNLGGTNIALKFLRINANGAKVSNKQGITGNFSMTDMIKTSDNKIVVTGLTFDNNTQAYTAKFSEDGTYIWSKTYPQTNTNYTTPYGVVEMSDKSLFIAGSDLGGNDHDFMILGYSEIGMELTPFIWGGANADELLAVTKSQDGELVGMGYTTSFTSNSEIYISKRKQSDGSEIWAKHFGDSWTQGADIALCPDGGFIICTGQNQPNADIVLVKTDSNGDFQ